MLGTFSCYSNKINESNDKNNNNISQKVREEIVDDTVMLNVSSKVEINNKGTVIFSYTELTKGSGIILYDYDNKEYYILSVAHLTPKIEHKEIVKDSTYMVGEIKLELVKEDRENDLALLRATSNLENYFDGKFAQNYELGDYIIGAGYPGEFSNIILYQGNISSDKNSNLIFLDGTLNFGHSGGPAYVFNEGKPYLVGINSNIFTHNGQIMPGIGGLIPLEKIIEFLEDTPLENDY